MILYLESSAAQGYNRKKTIYIKTMREILLLIKLIKINRKKKSLSWSNKIVMTKTEKKQPKN